MKNEFPYLTLPITAGSEYLQVKPWDGSDSD